MDEESYITILQEKAVWTVILNGYTTKTSYSCKMLDNNVRDCFNEHYQEKQLGRGSRQRLRMAWPDFMYNNNK